MRVATTRGEDGRLGDCMRGGWVGAEGYGVLYEQKESAREREKRELSQHTAADAAARR